MQQHLRGVLRFACGTVKRSKRFKIQVGLPDAPHPQMLSKDCHLNASLVMRTSDKLMVPGDYLFTAEGAARPLSTRPGPRSNGCESWRRGAAAPSFRHLRDIVFKDTHPNNRDAACMPAKSNEELRGRLTRGGGGSGG